MRVAFRKLTLAALGAAFAVTVSATDASAQMIKPWTGKGYFNVSAGSQTKARTQSMGDSFPLYDETATWETSIGVGSSSVFDIGGGVRLWHNLAAGISFTSYSDGTSATVSASIPDPLFFDQPHSSSLTVDGLDHKERAVHVSALFMIPLMNRLDVAVFAGPSFFSLEKELITDVTVPSGGTSISAATTGTIDRSATGGHVGFDLQYTVLPNVGGRMGIGAGVFVRYGSASIDAPEVNEGKIEVGGLNYGVGLRIRF
jgi:hypothetical protein